MTSGLTLELERVLPAPRARVWQMLTLAYRRALHHGGWTDGFERLQDLLQ